MTGLAYRLWLSVAGVVLLGMVMGSVWDRIEKSGLDWQVMRTTRAAADTMTSAGVRPADTTTDRAIDTADFPFLEVGADFGGPADNVTIIFMGWNSVGDNQTGKILGWVSLSAGASADGTGRYLATRTVSVPVRGYRYVYAYLSAVEGDNVTVRGRPCETGDAGGAGLVREVSYPGLLAAVDGLEDNATLANSRLLAIETAGNQTRDNTTLIEAHARLIVDNVSELLTAGSYANDRLLAIETADNETRDNVSLIRSSGIPVIALKCSWTAYRDNITASDNTTVYVDNATDIKNRYMNSGLPSTVSIDVTGASRLHVRTWVDNATDDQVIEVIGFDATGAEGHWLDNITLTSTGKQRASDNYTLMSTDPLYIDADSSVVLILADNGTANQTSIQWRKD